MEFLLFPPKDQEETKENIIKFYKENFANENYCYIFSLNKGFQSLFDHFFLKNTLPDIGNSIVFAVSQIENFQYFKEYDHLQIFDYFNFQIQNGKIKDKMAESAAAYISTVFRLFSFQRRQLTSFFMQNYMKNFDLLMTKVEPQAFGYCFKAFLFSANDDLSPPPNHIIYVRLANIFKANESLRSSIFSIIMDCAMNLPNSIMAMHQLVQISTWFNLKVNIPSEQMIWFVSKLNEKQPNVVSQCISPLISLFKDKPCDISNLIKIMNIIDDQTSYGYLTPNMLYDGDYLSVFVLNTRSEDLVTLFTQYPAFLQTTVDVFSQQSKKTVRSQIFECITNLAEYFPNSTQFVGICSAFFMTDPTPDNMRLYLQTIERTKDSSLLRSFNVVFANNKLSISTFVDINGITWIFNKYQAHLINAEQVSDFIGMLINEQSFPQIDYELQKLDSNDPLFKLDGNHIKQMIFGKIGLKYKYSQIRTFSLLQNYNNLTSLDPFNSYQLGKNYINYYLENQEQKDSIQQNEKKNLAQRLFGCRLFSEISNRYISPEYMDAIIQHPNKIDSFCSMRKDHFPIFQFYPSNEDTTLETSFNKIMFWVKFEDHFYQNEKDCEFLRIDNDISFSNSGNKLVISYLQTQNKKSDKTKDETLDQYPKQEQSQSTQIMSTKDNFDFDKWNLFYITINPAFMASQVTIQILTSEKYDQMNDLKMPTKSLNYNFEIKQKKQTFNCLTLKNHYHNNLMYIAPVIRTFKENPDIDYLFKKGPSYLLPCNKFNEDKTISFDKISQSNSTDLSTDSVILSRSKDFFSVPYNGFPLYFISYRDYILNLLENCDKDDERWLSYLKLCFNYINLLIIDKKHSKSFIQKIMGILLKRKEFITPETINSFIESCTLFYSIEETIKNIIVHSDIFILKKADDAQINTTFIILEALLNLIKDYKEKSIPVKTQKKDNLSPSKQETIKTDNSTYNFEVFLIQKIIEIHYNHDLLYKLLELLFSNENFYYLSNFQKYFITLLKISPLTRIPLITYDSLLYKEEDLLQTTVVEFLIDFCTHEKQVEKQKQRFNERNFKDQILHISEIIPFYELADLLTNSSSFEMKVKYFHLITLLSTVNKNYFKCDCSTFLSFHSSKFSPDGFPSPTPIPRISSYPQISSATQQQPTTQIPNEAESYQQISSLANSPIPTSESNLPEFLVPRSYSFFDEENFLNAQKEMQYNKTNPVQIEQIIEQFCILSSSEQVWLDVKELIKISEQYLYLGLVLIWCYSICYVHIHSFENENSNNVDALKPYYDEILDYYLNNITKIVQSKICVYILITFFPIIFNYPTLYRMYNDGDPATENMIFENLTEKQKEKLTQEQVKKNRKKQKAKEEQILQFFQDEFEKEVTNTPYWTTNIEVFSKSCLAMLLSSDLSFYDSNDQKKHSPIKYITHLISLILEKNSLHIPLAQANIVSRDQVQNMFSGDSNKLLTFITTIILQTKNKKYFSHIFESFFLSFPLLTSQRSDPFIPLLLHELLSNLPLYYSEDFDLHKLFRYIHLLCGLQLLTTNAYSILQDIFQTCSFLVVLHKQSDDLILNYSHEIHTIILYLFQQIEAQEFDLAFHLFNQNAQLFYLLMKKENSLYLWLYVFSLPSRYSSKFIYLIKHLLVIGSFTAEEQQIIDDFYSFDQSLHDQKPSNQNEHQTQEEKLRNLFIKAKKAEQKMNNEDLIILNEKYPILEHYWKESSKQFQTVFREYYAALKESIVHFFLLLSRKFAKHAYKTEVRIHNQYFLLAYLLTQTIHFVQCKHLIYEDSQNWHFLTSSIAKTQINQQKAIKISEINKQSRKDVVPYISSSCLPYESPSLVINSPFPSFDPTADDLTSVPYTIFKNNIKKSTFQFIMSTGKELHINFLRLFQEIECGYLEEPLFVKECKLIRYGTLFPCVVLFYPTEFVILCNTKLSKQEITQQYVFPTQYATSSGHVLNQTTINLFVNHIYASINASSQGAPPLPQTSQSKKEFVNNIDFSLNINDMRVLHYFLESVFLGEWSSNTSLFCSKIVFHIKTQDLLFLQPLDEKSISIWTYTHGAFILEIGQDSVNELRNYFTQINTKILSQLPPLPLLSRNKSQSEIESKWVSGHLSNTDLLLLLNAKDVRSFVNLSKYPVFPSVFSYYNKDGTFTYQKAPFDFSRGFSEEDNVTILSNTAPLSYFLHSQKTKTKPKHHRSHKQQEEEDIQLNEQQLNETGQSLLNETRTTLPASVFELPKLFDDSLSFNALYKGLESQEYMPQFIAFCSKMFNFKSSNQSSSPPFSSTFKSIASDGVSLMSQELSLHPNQDLILLYDNDRLIKAADISILLPSCVSTFLSISNSDRKLFIYDSKASVILSEVYDAGFLYAKGMSVSEDGIFIAVTYSFNSTDIFKITYLSSAPYHISKVTRFSNSIIPLYDQPEEDIMQNNIEKKDIQFVKSVISGSIPLCACVDGNLLIIWNIFTKTVHRKIEFESNIKYLSFDDKMSCFWCITDSYIRYVTNNCEIVNQLSLEAIGTITAFEIFQYPYRSNERCCVCGLSNGTIVFFNSSLSNNTLTYKVFQTPHKAGIKYITIHPSLKAFLTVDTNNSSNHWTAFNINSPSLKISLLKECPFCHNKCTTFCVYCHRAICSRCIIKQDQKDICPTCLALKDCLILSNSI